MFILALLILGVNLFSNIWVNLFFVPFMYFSAAAVLFKASPGDRAAYTVMYYTIMAGGEMPFELAYRLVQSQTGVSMEEHRLFFITLLIVEKLLIFLFVRLIETHNRRTIEAEGNRYAWYFVIFPVTAFVILSAFEMLPFPGRLTAQITLCAGAALLYFSTAAAFIMTGKLIAAMSKLRAGELMKARFDMEREHYARMEEVNEEHRKLLHDMDSYLGVMRNLAYQHKNDEILRFLDGLTDKENEISGRVCCSDKTMNALLAERAARAKRSDVRWELMVESGLPFDRIDALDLISMFGNLLDNAIEAAAKCGQGYVSAKFYMGGRHMLVLTVENSCLRVCKSETGGYRTTKDNVRLHGMGILNVRKLAGKYGGFLDLHEEGGIFSSTLALAVSSDDGASKTLHSGS